MHLPGHCSYDLIPIPLSPPCQSTRQVSPSPHILRNSIQRGGIRRYSRQQDWAVFAALEEESVGSGYEGVGKHRGMRGYIGRGNRQRVPRTMARSELPLLLVSDKLSTGRNGSIADEVLLCVQREVRAAALFAKLAEVA